MGHTPKTCSGLVTHLTLAVDVRQAQNPILSEKLPRFDLPDASDAEKHRRDARKKGQSKKQRFLKIVVP